MHTRTLVATFLFAFAMPCGLSAQDQEPTWVQLFNGKDLTGWTPKITGYELGENFGNTFRVVDGLLTVSYDQYEEFGGRFGHLFYASPFESYRLRVTYRFLGEQITGGPGWAWRNSGIMIHGQDPKTMGKDQNFPVSIEVQLLGGPEDGDRTTANLCTPGTNVVMEGKLIRRHCTNSTSKTYRGDQWVTSMVEVRGNRITHWVDGEDGPVLVYREPQLDDKDQDAWKLIEAGSPRLLMGGSISLQSESHPVQFKTVEIQALDDGWVDLTRNAPLDAHWTTKGNWQRSDDGVVALTPRPGESGWSRFDDYLWLEGQYGDFEMQFEYKVEVRGNSGFYFHVGDRKSPVAHGIEVQIFDSYGKPENAKLTDHDAGGIIPGIPPHANAARAPGTWNHVHVICERGLLLVFWNDTLVNRLNLDHPSIADRSASGSIGFQDHALPLALRNVRIKPL
ncbi:MAG: DUF1080 domain-containing protein [Planctomycetes bacterium]|nr:DUF1080 domain-containing protein [Planctomycetota bacterium]